MVPISLRKSFNPIIFIGFCVISFLACWMLGMGKFNALIISIFTFSILGSLFFWSFRLGFMFIGSAMHLFIGAVEVDDFIRYASLDVILFLISIMIIVGMMKEAGLFSWLIMLVFRMKNLTGRKLFLLILLISALFSALMGEVASIIIMTLTLLEICDMLDVEPLPFVISSILATNIGSAATVLGNPVGILIASRGGLSFEDFLVHALPNVLVNLLVTVLFLLFFYREYIQRVAQNLEQYTSNKAFIYLITIASDTKTRISIVIFCATIFLIALHKRLEIFFGLTENTLLLTIPILSAGIVLLYRHERSRHYIENEIEWPSIIFFMFLFAQAGVIQASGAAQSLAEGILNFAQSPERLVGFILLTNGLLSSILDNVVAVATYIPLIKEMEAMSQINSTNLWWALLFGACFGGNITLIGSTANIVALGLLEKKVGIRVTFQQWLKVGSIVGFLTLTLTYFLLTTHMFLFHL